MAPVHRSSLDQRIIEARGRVAGLEAELKTLFRSYGALPNAGERLHLKVKGDELAAAQAAVRALERKRDESKRKKQQPKEDAT